MIYRTIKKLIPTSAVAISIAVFIIASLIVTHISRSYYDGDFMENVLVEAHGMLFDILVIGVLILFLNKLAEKRIENRRYIDEIDDFRGWESDEAAYRIAGNLKRLKRNGYEKEINLFGCYLNCMGLPHDILEYFSTYLYGINLTGASLCNVNLRDAVLWCANLQDANLEGTDLQDADLQTAVLDDANLQGADLQDAYLRRVSNLTLEQLSGVKSLYGAKLDPELEEQVKEKYPHLLEEPVE